MLTISNIGSSRFSSESPIDLPLTRFRSIKMYTKKISDLSTPTLKIAEDHIALAYSANTTPHLDKAFATPNLKSHSIINLTISTPKEILAALKESWQAGVEVGKFSKLRTPAAEESAPRYVPIKELQQAEDRRRVARDASLAAPNRVEYLFYIQSHMGRVVESSARRILVSITGTVVHFPPLASCLDLARAKHRQPTPLPTPSTVLPAPSPEQVFCR